MSFSRVRARLMRLHTSRVKLKVHTVETTAVSAPIAVQIQALRLYEFASLQRD